jgi:hypothetical protein
MGEDLQKLREPASFEHVFDVFLFRGLKSGIIWTRVLTRFLEGTQNENVEFPFYMPVRGYRLPGEDNYRR